MKKSVLQWLIFAGLLLFSLNIFASPLVPLPASGATIDFGTIRNFELSVSQVIRLSHTSEKRKSNCTPGGSVYDEYSFQVMGGSVEGGFPSEPFRIEPVYAYLPQGIAQLYFIVTCTKGLDTPNGHYTWPLEITSNAAPSLYDCGSYLHSPISYTLDCTIGGNSPPDPVINDFSLIDADSGLPIDGWDPIPEGAKINLAKLPTTNLQIRANASPERDFGSVSFTDFHHGTWTSTCNETIPWSWTVDLARAEHPWKPALGTHFITATPHQSTGCQEPTFPATSLKFKVIQNPHK